MDIHEDAEKNLVTATFELPGLKKEDVSIDVQNNRLVVSGETTFSKESNEDGYIIKQRRRGKFSRMLPLPQGTQVSRRLPTFVTLILTNICRLTRLRHQWKMVFWRLPSPKHRLNKLRRGLPLPESKTFATNHFPFERIFLLHTTSIMIILLSLPALKNSCYIVVFHFETVVA